MNHGDDQPFGIVGALSGKWLLDRVAFDPMPVGAYYRVHPATLPGLGTVDPLSANPRSTARLALQPALVDGAPAVGMFYATDRPAGALFEALFRRAAIHPERRVAFPLADLANQCLSTVLLLGPVPLIPLALPARRMVVTDAQRDARWRELINTPDHADTHAAAVAVHAQVTAAGHQHAGLYWPSVQAPPALVYLLYDPPLRRDGWIAGTTVALDTPAGHASIAQALAEIGYRWVGDPSGPGFTPSDQDRDAV